MTLPVTVARLLRRTSRSGSGSKNRGPQLTSPSTPTMSPTRVAPTPSRACRLLTPLPGNWAGMNVVDPLKLAAAKGFNCFSAARTGDERRTSASASDPTRAVLTAANFNATLPEAPRENGSRGMALFGEQLEKQPRERGRCHVAVAQIERL